MAINRKIDGSEDRHPYICLAPSDPPNTTMVFPITEEEWPAMGGGPCVVTIQFHLGEKTDTKSERNTALSCSLLSNLDTHQFFDGE